MIAPLVIVYLGGVAFALLVVGANGAIDSSSVIKSAAAVGFALTWPIWIPVGLVACLLAAAVAAPGVLIKLWKRVQCEIAGIGSDIADDSDDGSSEDQKAKAKG